MTPSRYSPPAGWLSGEPDLPSSSFGLDGLPPASGSLEASLAPALPAPQPARGPAPAASAALAPPMHSGGAELPLQSHVQHYRPWPPPRLVGGPTSPPRSMGEIGEDFGGHLLGFSTLAVSIGAIVGTRYGGLYGGVAGSLFGGALVNVYRAVRFAMDGSPGADREAIVSGTYALAAAGFGGAVIYKLDRGARAVRNPSAPKTRCNESRRCGFRPIGP